MTELCVNRQLFGREKSLLDRPRQGNVERTTRGGTWRELGGGRASPAKTRPKTNTQTNAAARGRECSALLERSA